MSSIGKVQAALSNFTQETTLALASLNFDFALVKFDAPPEYHGLGAALSTKRRKVAESGSLHVVARKLGALFASILPKTPNLLHAYGQRVSETSASLTAKLKGPHNYGPFRDYVGVDGTSIWAAATSGPGALEVHLLACMLSVWSPARATSIWVELVEERKKELADETSEFVRIENVALSSTQISEEQLAEWDASARAWVRAADNASSNAEKQKHIRRIVEKFGKSVNSRLQPYPSVCLAWKTALETVDRIVGGSAYSVADGAVMLALSTWHLYPDLVVLGDHNEEIQQHDDLIKRGGVVTIGWENSRNPGNEGVKWSLSLSHLRYYGFPILAETGLSPELSRFSAVDLHYIAIGAILASWDITSDQLSIAMRLLHRICELVYHEMKSHRESAFQKRLIRRSWVSILFKATLSILENSETETALLWKLVKLGMRRRNFLTRTPTKIFLLQHENLCDMMDDQTRKIDFLRSIVKPANTDKYHFVVRVLRSDVKQDSAGKPQDFVYLDAHPLPAHSGSGHQTYRSWATSPLHDLPKDQQTIFATSELHVVEAKDIEHCKSLLSFKWYNAPYPAQEARTARGPQEGTTSSQNASSSSGPRPIRHGKGAASVIDCMPSASFHIVAGSAKNVALFYCKKDETDTSSPLEALPDRRKSINPKVVYDALAAGGVSGKALLEHLISLERSEETEDIARSLVALATIDMIYEHLPGATIAPTLISLEAPLAVAPWAVDVQQAYDWNHPPPEDGWFQFIETLAPPTGLSRACSFACIAMLELGTFKMDVSIFISVLAVSVDDSLYIAAPLLQDPSAIIPSYELRRVMGNIGHAGLALLIPPMNPKVREREEQNWRFINHETFDGTLDDCFKNTSLHLSFTGYTNPIVLGDHGGKFTEASFIESVVSVHDSGRWIADLDILAALGSSYTHTLVQQYDCKSKPAGHAPDFYITAVDNWDELRDLPENNPVVVRAHGNWQARLAATAVCNQLGYFTILFQRHGCWSCGEKLLQKHNKRASDGYAQRSMCGPVFLL